jgi:outer membrane immunogenic protein
MKKLSAIIAIVLMPTAVLAADLAPRAQDPSISVPVPYSWTGFYTGVQGGYAWMTSTNTGGDKLSPKGGFGGVYAGYNYQFGSNLVLGAEGDIDAGDIRGRSSILYQAPGSVSSRTDWFGSARLRAGYAFDRFLPYVTGGLAFEHSEVSAYYAGLGYAMRDNETRAGWTLGGGLEYAFTDNLIGRLEYRFSDYGRSSALPSSLPGATLDTRIRQTGSDVRAGVSYKF